MVLCFDNQQASFPCDCDLQLSTVDKKWHSMATDQMWTTEHGWRANFCKQTLQNFHFCQLHSFHLCCLNNYKWNVAAEILTTMICTSERKQFLSQWPSRSSKQKLQWTILQVHQGSLCRVHYWNRLQTNSYGGTLSTARCVRQADQS